MKNSVLFLSALVLSACASTAPVERPAIELPSAWRTPSDARSEGAPPWAPLLSQPELAALVDTALAGNRDLRATAARVDQALAGYGVQKSSRFPQISGQASAARGKTSTSPGRDNALYENGQVAAVLAWELDLWGRQADLSEASRQSWLSSEETYRAARVSLISQVAQTWLQLLLFDEQYRVAERTIENQSESLSLVEKRHKAGVASLVELSQARSVLGASQASLADIARSRSLTENALAILIGKPPQDIPRSMSLLALARPPRLSAGLPSELIAVRPDIRAAERALESTQRSVSAAKKAWLPSFSLTGVLGWASQDLTRIVASGSDAWSTGGAINLPIFNGGSISAQVDLSQARQREAAENYAKAVLLALGDVENALVAYQRLSEQTTALEQRAGATRERVRLAQMRYRAGVVDYSEVLYAQQDLLSAELGALQAAGGAQIALIQLYAALGGGS